MLYFDKENARWCANKKHRAQAVMVENIREAVNQDNETRAGNSAAVLPRDVATEFDRQQVDLMRANNLALLTDLMGLSRALAVGKIESIHRMVADSGNAVRSLMGQTALDTDKAGYSYSSTIKVCSPHTRG